MLLHLEAIQILLLCEKTRVDLGTVCRYALAGPFEGTAGRSSPCCDQKRSSLNVEKAVNIGISMWVAY